MKEKEAIYILRNAAWLGSDADRQKVEEAVEVAANAIEAQDMILYMNLPEVSAEEVVEILKRNNRIELLPSAQPEKTQLSGESTTKDSTFDCVSRQAVIDWLGNEWDGMVVHAFDGIKNIPSAHCDNCPYPDHIADGGKMDCISRQATITEIKNYERDSTAPIDYVKIVEQMPPAQPDARYINANELIKRLQQAGLDDAVSIAVKMAGHERLKHVPSAQPDLIAKIQNGINTTNANDSYSCGMRNGMRWCMSLVDGKEPLFENCPSVQPERPKGHWIYVGDGYTDYFKCSECGNLSDYEKNFCCDCGSDNRGEQDE